MHSIRLLVLVGCCMFLSGIACEVVDENDSVVGGTAVTSTTTYPYMALIMDKTAATGGVALCSGSLIAPTKILTTATCAAKLTAGTSAVYLNTLTGATSTTRVERLVNTILSQPLYVAATKLHDVAILTLNAAVPTSLTSVSLPVFDSSVPLNAKTTIVGWGTPAGAATTLQQASVTVVSNKICSAAYGSNTFLPNLYICTVSSTAGMCALDEGAPMIYNGKQVGILNSQSRCGAGEPVAALNIAVYSDWINANKV